MRKESRTVRKNFGTVMKESRTLRKESATEDEV